MRVPSKMFRRIPVARKLLAIVLTFVSIVLCVFYLGVFRSQILSGVRAYVGGEGMWSKAEKRAALSLTKYADDQQESDYQEYLSEIAVPMGDKQARLELQKPSPDFALVRQGFVQGHIDPQDIENMAMMFRRFGGVGYMARAIAVWTEADREIDQLPLVAEQLRSQITSPQPDKQQIQRLAKEVVAVDARLTPLEDEFSAVLGQGARWIDRMLSIVTLLASGLLLLIGIGFSTSVFRQIRNADEKYVNLINTANDAILVIDAGSREVLEANKKACELLGRSAGQIIGMTESELYLHEKGSTPEGLLDPRTALEPTRELGLLRSDGTVIPVEVSVSSTKLQGSPAILGIFRDIRDRREAAAVLRRSQDRFTYLIENLSDVITVVAVDGTMVYHSPSIQRVAGYQAKDLLGQSFLKYIHPEDESAVRAALERVTLRVGSEAPPEFRFRHKDGSWVWLESVGNNLLNDVAVGGIVVTSRDVTARRTLEDQVRQSQKMEAVGRLAGGIAHDFNNLLMVIQGYAEIVLQEETISPSSRKSVETIARTTESAANLTRQLLSFSRKHAFSPQVIDLNLLVNRMSEMLLGLMREEMEFIVKLSTQPCCANADPGQIEQVIMNLVVNARDAMPAGGAIKLETSHVRYNSLGLDKPSDMPEGEYVVLSVSDTGVGMDAATQSRMFEPFFTTKSKDEGTGLGLAVVYNIVRGSRGHIRVSSEPGHGSTVQVFLPRVETAPTVPVVASPPQPMRAGMETILVAEDQPDLRWMICQFLQSLGYSVLEAKDGHDAVALADQYQGNIDIVLTDVVMPHIRGSEVARRLAQSRPDIKIIFMSGYTEGQVSSRDGGGLDANTTILQKPFELEFLATKLREVIETRSRR